VAGYNFDLNVLVKGLGGVNQLSNSISRLDKQGASLGNTFRIVRAALVAFGGTQVIGRAIELEKSIEKTRLSFNALTGSLAAGSQAYQQATKFSSQFGFEQEKVLKATQGLLLAGINLNQIPSIMQTLGGAARATGADVDNLAEEYVRLKTSGAASAKTLGPLLEQYLGKVVYDSIKESADLSEKEFKNLGPRLGSALQSGSDGMISALEQVKQNFDTFISTFLGTNNADAMREVGKAIAFITENIKLLQIALVAILAAVFPVTAALLALGAVAVKFGMHIQDVYRRNKDLVPAIDDTGQAYQNQMEPLTAITNKTAELAVAIGQCTDGLPGLTEEFKKLAATHKQIYDATEALKNSIGTTLQAIEKEFSTLNILQDSLRSGFTNIGNAATEAFVGVIRGTMSARDAGRMLANAIVTEVITAFVRLFIVGPLMAWLAESIFGVVDAERSQADAVERTNRALQKQIGLRLLLMALGLAKGGPVQAGGQPAQARAAGGTVSGNMPYLVGERGPELFMPNSNGNIIPNDKLNMGGGSDYGSSAMGSANITFNINTVDARDFDKLLMTRQDMIIGMINKGLQERGKRSLTA